MPEVSVAEQTLAVVLAPDDSQRLANLVGQFDEHIRQIEDLLALQIKRRGNRFEITGPEAAARTGAKIIEDLFKATEQEILDPQRVHMAIIAQTSFDGTVPLDDLIIHARRRNIRARGPNQIAYARAMRESDLTFGIVNEYLAPTKKVYHFDLYRIRHEEELYEFGFEDYLDEDALI